MANPATETDLPAIPVKRYFTIGEVSELCGVKAHVLRYWEQEFTQLSPIKRRGNRRYYQHHEVLLIRHIRQLLYQDGFTISGARAQLVQIATQTADAAQPAPVKAPDKSAIGAAVAVSAAPASLRRELFEILALLRSPN